MKEGDRRRAVPFSFHRSVAFSAFGQELSRGEMRLFSSLPHNFRLHHRCYSSDKLATMGTFLESGMV